MNKSNLTSKNRNLSFAFAKSLAAITGLFLFVDCLGGHAQAADLARDGNPGYLQVFSSTEQSQWGEGSTYFLHTGYRIFDANGKAVKWVANHSDSADETPEKVELAPGRYTIWAQSDRGYVRTPVVVKASAMTTLCLEAEPFDKKCLAME